MRLAWALLLFACLPHPIRADDPPAKTKRYAALLAKECDEFIASAIKRPYGWGWAEVDESPEAKKTVVRNLPVALEPGMTPAAGLILYSASKLLDEPKYAEAARNVARGIAAAQQSTGKFPSVALFGPTSAGSKEPPAPLPDRAATRASLGLLLTLIEEGKPPEAIDRAGARGVAWLIKQQSETGAWLVMFPPGASPTQGVRLARLDSTECRNCILATILGYEVLGDPFQRRSVERSLGFLLKARIWESAKIGAGLWRSAYTVNAVEAPPSDAFPDAIDTLASRYSMQTIFSAWVMLGDAPRLSACEVGAKSLEELIKGDDHLWHRRFSLNGGSMDPPAAKAGNSPFGLPDSSPEPPMASDPGLTPTLAAINAGKELGREKLRERLSADDPLKQRLAEVIAGLADEPMAVDFPKTPEEAATYLKRDALFTLIDAPPPSDLAGKIKRFWAIYLRARLETRFAM